MAHRNLVATNKKLFGRTIFKSDKPLVETQQSVAPRIRQTQRQLEVLEREALVKRARAKGKRIRGKVRLSGNPTS